MTKLIELPTFPGYYAGEDGFIYSSKIGKKIKRLKGKPTSTSDYLYICLCIGEKRIYRSVHGLVCRAFHGPPPGPEYTASHEDGNNKNNIPSNLLWETLKDNAARKKAHGTFQKSYTHHACKVTPEQVESIRREFKPRSGMAPILAEKYGVGKATIWRIVNGSRYAE